MRRSLPPLPIARCTPRTSDNLMNINPSYLEISFDKVGVRDSQKRLKEMIGELVVEPLKSYQDELLHQLPLVQAIVEKRVAAVISYWALHKSKPAKPSADSTMSQITNASKNSMTVEEFYKDQVRDSLYSLAPLLALELPDTITVGTDELEYALNETEEKFDAMQSNRAELLEENIEEAELEEEKPAAAQFSPRIQEAPKAAPKKEEEIPSFNFSSIPEKKEERIEV